MARIIFAGSPAVAVPFLRALTAQHDIVAVVTRVDSPVGRKRVLTPTPVAYASDELGLSCVKTNSLRGVSLPPADLGVIVAYGGMVPKDLLDWPTAGWLNVHFSLLPMLRGAAPLQRGMWNGDDHTGVSVFRLVEELDAGPIAYQRAIRFHEDESASDALERMAQEMAPELLPIVNGVLSGSVPLIPQQGTITFAPKFERDDGRIDFTQDAMTVDRRIRAVTTEPGAFVESDGVALIVERARVDESKVLEPGELEFTGKRVYVGTATTAVELLTVKPAGKSAMPAAAWARGLRSPIRFT
jgi:methionyl-tRNA formyltransferase